MTSDLLDPVHSWLYYGGFWLLLIIVAAAEAVWPMHVAPRQPKGRLLTNFGMGLLNMALLTVLPVSLVAAAVWAETNGFGLLNLVSLHWVAAAALTIVVRSLAGYWLHHASHSNRLLWRVHRVHHCDVAVDLSTGFRNHPLEALIVAAFMVVVTGLAGLSPWPLALYESAALAFSIWTHANLRIPARIEPIVRSLFVTPDMHHVHHSAVERETDSNYGDVFSLWDRLFGTYYALDRAELCALRLGLGDAHDGHAASITRQLRAPLLHEGSEAGADPR